MAHLFIYLIIIIMNICVKPMPKCSLSEADRRRQKQPVRGRLDRGSMVSLGQNAPPVRRAPMPLARRFFQICTAIAAEAYGAVGLTPLQFAALPYLSKQSGDPGIDQNGLAARLGIDRNNVSLLVDQLEAMGLVERRVNGVDRRARQLFLLAKGEKLLERLYPTVASDVAHRILAPLEPDERELLLDLLIRVIRGNMEHARPGAGRRKRNSQRSPTRKI
jgi:DNA-binding MarR family transcriptional regulator